MKSRNTLLAILWILVFAAIPVWISLDSSGWDFTVYAKAAHALASGRDPYADAIAIQRAAHEAKLVQPNADPPYSYVYSPITLPLLRAIAHAPAKLFAAAYWLIYILGVLAEIWIAMLAVEESERSVFLFLAPLAPFFPGFIANGVVLSGNIAYLLYPAMLLCAVYGWKRGSWRWFYVATLAASCVKAPLLSLLLLPVLSARRQWIPAGVTGALGLALFALQPRLWPTLFKEYLQAVELQFSYNRDFGCSPAGLFSGYLFDHGLPYSPAALIFFLSYALPLCAVLFYLSRQYLRGAFSWKQWFPILLTGVILLNPRLIEYDTAPLALPLALIGWRFLRARMDSLPSTVILVAVFAVTNFFGLRNWNTRLLIDGPLLVLFFLAGSWDLAQQGAAYASRKESSLAADFQDDVALASGG